MTEQGYVQTTTVYDVDFHEPDAEVRRIIRDYHRRHNLLPAVIATISIPLLTAFGLLFDAAFLIGVVLIFSIPLAIGYWIAFLYRPNYQVRIANVIDYYTYTKKHQRTTYYHLTLRLNETGELIHNLHVTLHMDGAPRIGENVVLCKGKRGFCVYSAEGLDVPVWDPAQHPDRTAEPDTFTQYAHEITVRDIPFHPLDPQIREAVVDELTSRNDIIAIAGGFASLAVFVPLLSVFCFPDHWYIIVLVTGLVLGILGIGWRKSNNRTRNDELVGARITITEANDSANPVITFTVDETDQTVVRQYIDLSFCTKLAAGDTVMLVHGSSYDLSIHPLVRKSELRQ